MTAGKLEPVRRAEEIAIDRPFKEPVCFMRGTGMMRHVRNTNAALYFLEHKVLAEGSAHQKARDVCRQVMDGRGSPQIARNAFVKALEEMDFDVVQQRQTMGRAAHPLPPAGTISHRLPH
jgi:hypothetical protein